MEKTNYILDTLSTEYTQQTYIYINVYKVYILDTLSTEYTQQTYIYKCI